MSGGKDSIVKEEETMLMEDDLSSSGRREIRSSYREIENSINEGKDEIGDATSKKFKDIINKVDNIHQYVSRPREQVADAETLLGLTSILMTSVRSHASGGVTPSEFVSCLIKRFGQQKIGKGFSDNTYSLRWQVLGSHPSAIFKTGPGCRTMIGPMKNKLKQRKYTVRARRAKYMKNTLPKELETKEMISDTDLNILMMFEVLKRKKKAEVESLILNRNSFSQTIENLFALSFLVKDGRVLIGLDETGGQVIVPRNGPSAEEIRSGIAKNHQFMFRLDFDDWKMMKRSVPEGEELMQQRYKLDTEGS